MYRYTSISAPRARLLALSASRWIGTQLPSRIHRKASSTPAQTQRSFPSTALTFSVGNRRNFSMIVEKEPTEQYTSPAEHSSDDSGSGRGETGEDGGGGKEWLWNVLGVGVGAGVGVAGYHFVIKDMLQKRADTVAQTMNEVPGSTDAGDSDNNNVTVLRVARSPPYLRPDQPREPAASVHANGVEVGPPCYRCGNEETGRVLLTNRGTPQWSKSPFVADYWRCPSEECKHEINRLIPATLSPFQLDSVLRRGSKLLQPPPKAIDNDDESNTEDSAKGITVEKRKVEPVVISEEDKLEAEVLFRRAVRACPTSPRARVSLASLLSQSVQEEAAKLQGDSKDPNAKSHLERRSVELIVNMCAALEHADGDRSSSDGNSDALSDDEARMVALGILTSGGVFGIGSIPATPHARLRLRASSISKPTEADSDLSQLDPNEGDTLDTVQEDSVRQGLTILDLAMRRLTNITEDAPVAADALFWMGKCHAALKDDAAAAYFFARSFAATKMVTDVAATNANQTSVAAAVEGTELAVLCGAEDQALSLARDAYARWLGGAINDDDGWIRCNLVLALTACGRFKEAEELGRGVAAAGTKQPSATAVSKEGWRAGDAEAAADNKDNNKGDSGDNANINNHTVRSEAMERLLELATQSRRATPPTGRWSRDLMTNEVIFIADSERGQVLGKGKDPDATGWRWFTSKLWGRQR